VKKDYKESILEREVEAMGHGVLGETRDYAEGGAWMSILSNVLDLCFRSLDHDGMFTP
ncbi:hypothetical protein FB639_003009, partial [Coemansia asiatica]